MVPLGLGLQGELGLIVAGSGRADFPRQTEKLILSVAANQGFIGLQEARLLSEQKRVAIELDRRIAQRTAELAATNEELRKQIAVRQRAEEALRASERDLSLIIETIPGLVWCAGPDGHLNYLNQRILDYTGTSPGDWAQLGWTSFLHPDDAQPTAHAWSRAVDTGRPFEIQCRLRRSDGVYRWFQVFGQAAHQNGGRVTRWYGLLIDIDDRRNMEEALRESQVRLSRATQTATVGQFAASIAHEINQPLAAVVASGHACLRFLSAQPPNVAGAIEAAQSIVRDGKDAGEVVRRIRPLFKRTAIEKSMVNVNDAIGEVLRLLAGEIAKRGVSVETDLWENAPLVYGDRVQLQQLILNLLVNGMDAMDSVSNRPKKLWIRSNPGSHGQIQIELRDNGVGLQDADRIFEAFFTTKENGMGMGLAICRSIVEAHHGKLWIAPQEGPGATFCVRLPLTASAE
jgi:PAS domain S-box-containing protein